MTQQSIPAETLSVGDSPERWVRIHLTPVEVFGAEDGYGLCDATSAWSDCNRARGHITHVDDLPGTKDPERVRIEVLVAESDLAALVERSYGNA